jgi:hypothetical protein
MGYTTQLVLRADSNDEARFFDEQSRWDPIYKAHNRSAPPPLQNERLDQYDRRLTHEAAQKFAPKYKDLNIHEAQGSTYKLIKEQIYEDASKEALRPAQVPDGELKEVTRYDHAGRPYSEFYGRPSVWLSQFADDKRKMVTGFKTETERGYRPNNISPNLLGTKY